ncbi:MAG: CpsB/CapC family capsule biosynthesis tyrosine phosphatase [Candidatus Eisenbacteria bacterium]
MRLQTKPSMVDIHSHVIPFVDFDGPQTLEESLEMLKLAVGEGVRCVVATPHLVSGDPSARLKEIADAFDLLSESVEKERLPVEVRLGYEIYMSPDLYDFVKETPVWLDGTGQSVLVELPMYEFPPYLHSQLLSLISEKTVPVVAHPERNTAVVKNPDVLFSLSKAGVLFQINCGSLLGVFGKEVKRASWALLNSGLCHFVASDAHNTRDRSFTNGSARLAVEKAVGLPVAGAVFEENAARILRLRDPAGE